MKGLQSISAYEVMNIIRKNPIKCSPRDNQTWAGSIIITALNFGSFTNQLWKFYLTNLAVYYFYIV